ncbi:hypothetical protein, partial [Gluconobacter oxydans]|uniref:hypothetical protein n=1 Tax=Gluconobacter oxydans TaxID=442 RepID=UPI001E3BF706
MTLSVFLNAKTQEARSESTLTSKVGYLSDMIAPDLKLRRESLGLNSSPPPGLQTRKPPRT